MVSFQNSTDFSPWQFQQVKYLKVPNFCIFYLEFVFFRCHHDCSDPGFWALCTEEQQQGSAAIVHADACYFTGRHSNGGIGSRRDSSAAEVAQIDPRKPLGPRSFLYAKSSTMDQTALCCDATIVAMSSKVTRNVISFKKALKEVQALNESLQVFNCSNHCLPVFSPVIVYTVTEFPPGNCIRAQHTNYARRSVQNIVAVPNNNY